MDKGYEVRQIGFEGIQYCDERDIYRFNLAMKNKTWIVYLPGTKGKYQPHELTDEERDLILPRIQKYLERKKYFMFFGSTYPVKFEREESVSPEMAERRRRVAEWWAAQEKSDKR